MLGGSMLDKPFRKNPSFVWILLCLAVFLSCLPRLSLRPAESRLVTDNSSALQETAEKHLDLYSDRIHAYLTKGESSLFLSRLSKAHRIPLRLPIPQLWISYLLCLAAGLLLLFRHPANRQEQTEHTGNYIIRYIHDQNGETYRPFLS